MPVFQFGGWPSGAHLASYLYQDLSISAILWLQREDPVGYRYCEYDQVPQKTLEMNKKAFLLGLEAAKDEKKYVKI